MQAPSHMSVAARQWRASGRLAASANGETKARSSHRIWQSLARRTDNDNWPAITRCLLGACRRNCNAMAQIAWRGVQRRIRVAQRKAPTGPTGQLSPLRRIASMTSSATTATLVHSSGGRIGIAVQAQRFVNLGMRIRAWADGGSSAASMGWGKEGTVVAYTRVVLIRDRAVPPAAPDQPQRDMVQRYWLLADCRCLRVPWRLTTSSVAASPVAVASVS